MTRVLIRASPLLLAVGCAVAPPPPSPDPFAGGARAEGRLGDSVPAETAFCVSRGVPLSTVLLVSDGAAVRPAPGALAAGQPDYALTLRRSEGGIAWVRQVGDAAPPAAMAAAERLDGALADCASAPGGRA